MDETPFFKKPWFYIAAWLVILLVLYGWQIFRLGGVQASILYILLDLACLFPALLVLWIAFFAQFVLPVRTFRDRQKIFDRLITYLSGGHGPAMFIRDGELIKREGEERQKGPGVLWLDTASAAVTRTAVKIKQTIGPGVHFLDNGEHIAGIVDLHVQSHAIGPKESDLPFDSPDNYDEAEYKQIQERRKQVSAWTRDGIEIVPNISVSFRVDTGFPKEGQPGSRFGYRVGITKKEKEKEAQDKEAIQKAILGEGINPNISSDSPGHRVAWNQLPALLAVDVWREYAAKFTLDELFRPEQLVPPPPPKPPEIVEEDIDPLTLPLQRDANQSSFQFSLLTMLREINKRMDRAIKWLDRTKTVEPKAAVPEFVFSPVSPLIKGEPSKRTALQVINEMVKARLTQAEVDAFDDHGGRTGGTTPSPEFALLQQRGIKVLSAGISTVRFNPKIEETIISRWSGSWYKTAEDEKKQIERKRNILETSGQEKAIRQYADQLSHDLLQKQPQGVKETLKALVMSTRAIIIKNDPLRRGMSDEQAELEEIIKWMEAENS